MNGRTWPETLCGKHPHVSVPFRWRGWIVCTDKVVAALIPNDGRGCGDGPDPSKSEKVFACALEPLDQPHTFGLDELRDFCGEHVEPCSVCRGIGWIDCECAECGHEHDSGCPACDGARLTIQGRAHLDGAVFDIARLAQLLDGAPGETVTMSRQESDRHPIILHAEEWRGLLMPMKRDPDRTDPVYSLPESLAPQPTEPT